jgi:hypothetical protein
MDSSTADLQANMPNNSLMYSAFTPTFGNLSFQISPSQTGEVSNSFGTIPYLSLEALVYMQQMNAQMSPVNVLPGQNTGQQNVQGQYTVTDQTGNVRVQIGSGSF